MRPSKKTMRNAFAARHGAQSASIRNCSKSFESFPINSEYDNSPRGRTWIDRARGNNGPLAGRMTFKDGTPKLAEGLGGVYPEWDQVESLSDFANAEFRLAMAEAA